MRGVVIPPFLAGPAWSATGHGHPTRKRFGSRHRVGKQHLPPVSASTRMARRGYADGDAETRGAPPPKSAPDTLTSDLNEAKALFLSFLRVTTQQRTVHRAETRPTGGHARGAPSPSGVQERQSCRPPVATALPAAGSIAVRCARTARQPHANSAPDGRLRDYVGR